MGLLLFTNNADSTLASPVSAVATSLTVAAGTGAKFPQPNLGTTFKATIRDANTGLIREIVLVGDRANDVFSLTRAQEGTTAQAWSAGDKISNFVTAGTADAFVQANTLQHQLGNYAVDSGVADSYVITLNPVPNPNPLALVNLVGMPLRVLIGNANLTTTPTLTVNGLAPKTIVNPDNTPLTAGQIPAGAIVALFYNQSQDKFQLSSLTVNLTQATTGDLKFTIKTAADPGWILINDGTLGNGSSGATNANAAYGALFALFWNGISNTFAPVGGGRGANAAADFAAGKTIQMTRMLGRVLGIAGSGSGLTPRGLGSFLGEENHTMLLAELVGHTHSVSGAATSGGDIGSLIGEDNKLRFDIPITTSSTGSATPFNVMQPSTFLNMMIKT